TKLRMKTVIGSGWKLPPQPMKVAFARPVNPFHWKTIHTMSKFMPLKSFASLACLNRSQTALFSPLVFTILENAAAIGNVALVTLINPCGWRKPVADSVHVHLMNHIATNLDRSTTFNVSLNFESLASMSKICFYT